MTPEQFRAMGEALFGDVWQTPLAAELNVAIRSVQRWTSGTNPIPDDIIPKFESLCRRRGLDLIDFADRLKVHHVKE